MTRLGRTRRLPHVRASGVYVYEDAAMKECSLNLLHLPITSVP